ncbi:hypothetical protein D3C76_1293780 [compost metagenome]
MQSLANCTGNINHASTDRDQHVAWINQQLIGSRRTLGMTDVNGQPRLRVFR